MYKGPSHPSADLLSTSAPLKIWDLAMRQAKRSPMIRFKVGAVIFNPSTGKVISHGCSNPDISFSKSNSSIHAEHHAISRTHNADISDHFCAIYTVGCRGGAAWTSRPCYSCASLLQSRGLARVIYAERTAKGWLVKGEHPEEMLLRAPKPTGKYARQQRIPAIS